MATTTNATTANLTAALQMLALGCPVELTLPGRWEPVICWPDDHGPAVRLLWNHPEIRVDLPEWARPDDAALRGGIPRVCRRPARPHAARIGSGRHPGGDLVEPADGWPINGVLAAFADIGYKVRRQRAGIWRTKCPYHGGTSGGSLVIGEQPDGRVWLHCFSRCRWVDICGVLGLKVVDGGDGLRFPDLEAPDPERLEARARLQARLEEIRREAAA